MTDIWKTTTRPTETSSHVGMVFDRSPEGLDGAATLLKEFPGLDVRLAPWKESQDEFFVFILEMESRRVGSVTVPDLKTLIADALPELFRLIEAPPALPNFAVVVEDESRHQAILSSHPICTRKERNYGLSRDGVLICWVRRIVCALGA